MSPRPSNRKAEQNKLEKYPLRKPPGAHQPSHLFEPEDDSTDICKWCGRHVSTYVHMLFAHSIPYDPNRKVKVMGMLDANVDLKPFGDKFAEGEVFTLQDAKMGPEIPTEYGQQRPVMLKINGDWYSIFGQGLGNQVQEMDDSDRQAMRSGNMRVKVARKPTRRGAIKLLVSANTQTDATGTLVGDEAPF